MSSLITDQCDSLVMETKHIKYRYKKFTLIIICAFVIALIIPRIFGNSLRYSEFRIVWQIGVTVTMILHGLSILFSIINLLFTFLEFRETKKWNLLWLILSLVPFLYWTYWLTYISFFLNKEY